MENLTTQVYLDPRTVPSGPNCVCRGESGANFDPELFVSGPQPVSRGVARYCAGMNNYILLLSEYDARMTRAYTRPCC